MKQRLKNEHFTDHSNGYEQVAETFNAIRSKNTIGVSSVQNWVQGLPAHASILELGCGTGLPITKVLLEQAVKVYAIDASPTLLSNFRQNFPDVPNRLEAVQNSDFFGRKFDGILAWGLLFLLSEGEQIALIKKASESLVRGGRFLFTAPEQPATWKDVLTGQPSVSLGSTTYRSMLSNFGMEIIDTFQDEGENHYFEAQKI